MWSHRTATVTVRYKGRLAYADLPFVVMALQVTGTVKNSRYDCDAIWATQDNNHA